jgi:hypothetical protein
MLELPHTPNGVWTGGAIIPAFDLTAVPDLWWLRGLEVAGGQPGYDVLTQVFQVIRLVAGPYLGGPSHDSMTTTSRTLRLSYPFIGVLTHDDVGQGKVVLSAFFADKDCWVPESRH